MLKTTLWIPEITFKFTALGFATLDKTWEVNCSTGILLSFSVCWLFGWGDFPDFSSSFSSLLTPPPFSPSDTLVLPVWWFKLRSKFCAPCIKLEWKLDSRIRTCNAEKKGHLKIDKHLKCFGLLISKMFCTENCLVKIFEKWLHILGFFLTFCYCKIAKWTMWFYSKTQFFNIKPANRTCF